MQLRRGKFCPLIKEDCLELKCAWFVQLRGNDPQTGKEMDEWGCAVTWNPVLQIETAQQGRQAGAAVESFRNEMVKANQQNQQLFAAATINAALEPGID